MVFTGISIFIQVLGLLWYLSHSEDCSTEILDQAPNAHIKILDYSCAAVYKIVYMAMTHVAVLFTQERDQNKPLWLERCLAELKSDTWVLPAIKTDEISNAKNICAVARTVKRAEFPDLDQRTNLFTRKKSIHMSDCISVS